MGKNYLFSYFSFLIDADTLVQKFSIIKAVKKKRYNVVGGLLLAVEDEFQHC